MDPAPSLGCSLKDVKWSSVAVPLDLLVSTYRLPQIARLDSGESRLRARGRRARTAVWARVPGGWDPVGSGLPAPQRRRWPERLPQRWRGALNSPQQQRRDGNQSPCSVIKKDA